MPLIQQVSYFVGSLKKSIKIDDQANKPMSLLIAIGMAWLCKTINNSIRRGTQIESQKVALTIQMR